LNYLAHLNLVFPDPDLMTGGFLGDFVKGRLAGNFPAGIEQGIQLHRSIDAFTDRHPVFLTSCKRFTPKYARYAPIIMDIVFDHFLARNWLMFSPLSISQFSDETFAILSDQNTPLNDSARRTAEAMAQRRTFESYDQAQFVEHALAAISRRLKRQNPMAEAMDQFIQLAPELEADFLNFYPKLIDFSRSWQKEHL
jgi:acyl carrier protein phosphodiesterase